MWYPGRRGSVREGKSFHTIFKLTNLEEAMTHA
jgi:hypothetical protein